MSKCRKRRRRGIAGDFMLHRDGRTANVSDVNFSKKIVASLNFLKSQTLYTDTHLLANLTGNI